MKKWLILVLLVIINIVSLSSVNAEVLFIEPFDYVDSSKLTVVSSNWSLGGGSETYITIQNNSLYLDTYSGNTADYWADSDGYFSSVVADTSHNRIDYSVMFLQSPGGDLSVRFRTQANASGWSGTRNIDCWADETLFLACYDGSTTQNLIQWASVDFGVYTNISFRNINYSGDSYDVYINDKLNYSNMGMPSTLHPEEMLIYMKDVNTNSGWYVDNIRVCNGLLCNAAAPPVGDSTPPVINSHNQIPADISLTSVLLEELNITYDITDAGDGTNDSTVQLFLKLNDTTIYTNGSLTPPYSPHNYQTKWDNKYEFEIDENLYFGGTYNINETLMEETDHKNVSLSNLNNWHKYEFLNVSNNVRQTIAEAMWENASVPDISTYYYCNSSYSSGNPVSNSNCALVFSGSNAEAYNHSHNLGKSKHKFIPMGINIETGKIGGVYVTPMSYILKRGTVEGDLMFYITNPSRVSVWETSNNNGNTWSTFTDPDTSAIATPDIHIHQIQENASINYYVRACDVASNCVNDSWYGDKIQFPDLPPNPVTIFTPIEGGSYNTTLQINYSESVSPSGINITKYVISYKKNTSSTWTTVIDNGLNLGYSWDISSILNGGYDLRVVVTDQQNFTSTSIRSHWEINNDLTIDQQLLTALLSQVEESNDLAERSAEGINMLWFWIVFIAFALIPIFIRDRLTTESFNQVSALGVLVYIILLIALFYVDLGITGLLRTILVLVTIYLAYRNAMNAGMGKKQKY